MPPSATITGPFARRSSKRLAIAGDFTGESTRPVNRQRGIDEATLPERYSACNTTERPDAAWAAQSKRKGPMRRGPPRDKRVPLPGESRGGGGGAAPAGVGGVRTRTRG